MYYVLLKKEAVEEENACKSALPLTVVPSFPQSKYYILVGSRRRGSGRLAETWDLSTFSSLMLIIPQAKLKKTKKRPASLFDKESGNYEVIPIDLGNNGADRF